MQSLPEWQTKLLVRSDGAETGEAEDSQLYCFCMTPWQGRFMVQCDRCDELYYGTCVKTITGSEHRSVRMSKMWVREIKCICFLFPDVTTWQPLRNHRPSRTKTDLNDQRKDQQGVSKQCFVSHPGSVAVCWSHIRDVCRRPCQPG